MRGGGDGGGGQGVATGINRIKVDCHFSVIVDCHFSQSPTFVEANKPEIPLPPKLPHL